MLLKENLNDTKTIQQINKILKPQEFTRLDGLIEVIFLTTKDVKTEEIEESEIEQQEAEETGETFDHTTKYHPVNFHEGCVERIQKHLQTPLIKKSRSSYTTADNTIGIICSISKRHGTEASPKYWFAFHPYYDDFLATYSQSYIAYGCGAASKVVLIPYEVFKPLVPDFWKTEKRRQCVSSCSYLRKRWQAAVASSKKNYIDITDRLV